MCKKFARSQKFKNRQKVDQKSKSLQEVLQEVSVKVLVSLAYLTSIKFKKDIKDLRISLFEFEVSPDIIVKVPSSFKLIILPSSNVTISAKIKREIKLTDRKIKIMSVFFITKITSLIRIILVRNLPICIFYTHSKVQSYALL